MSPMPTAVIQSSTNYIGNDVGVNQAPFGPTRSFPIDPYQLRADDIGPSHDISGIGHLGTLLTPPEWVPGNMLMSPEEAKQAFLDSRGRATKALETDVVGDGDLSDDELQRKMDARNKRWAKEFKLDKLILEQRISIFECYSGNSHSFQRGILSGDNGANTLDPFLAGESARTMQHKSDGLARQMEEINQAVSSPQHQYIVNQVDSFQESGPMQTSPTSTEATLGNTSGSNQADPQPDGSRSMQPTPPAIAGIMLSNGQDGPPKLGNEAWSYLQSCLKNRGQGSGTTNAISKMLQAKKAQKASHGHNDIRRLTWNIGETPIRSQAA